MVTDPVVVRTVVDWPMDAEAFTPGEAVDLVRQGIRGMDPGLVRSPVVRYAGAQSAPRPVEGEPVDLVADGVLFMVNVVLFHPRGFSLALLREPVGDDGGTRERLVLFGDGSERWCFSEDGAEAADNDSLWERFHDLLRRAVEANATPAAL